MLTASKLPINNLANVRSRKGTYPWQRSGDPAIQDEERHVDFLEAQLQSIQDIGIGNYLTEQMKD